MTATVRRCWGRLAAAVAVLTLVLLANAAPAFAHDVLISTSPTEGATLATPPTKVVLTFDEPVQNIGDAVTVTGPDGHEFQTGRPTVVDARVTQALAPLTSRGRYVVAYRIVSADGHPVSERLHFTLRHAAAPGQPDQVSPASGATGAAPGATSSGRPSASVIVAALVVLCLVGGGIVITLARGRTGESGSSGRAAQGGRAP